MTDPDLLSLFKKRFLKVKLRLPQKPGTYDAIMRVVKAAFLEQKVSVHIDQDKVEYVPCLNPSRSMHERCTSSSQTYS